MIFACWGLAGTGKSTVGLTFPEPIWIADFDLRLGNKEEGGALVRFPNLQYEAIKYPLPLQLLSDQVIGVRQLWQRFLQDYVAVLEDKKLYNKIPFATIMIDTATKMRRAANEMTLQVKQEAQIARGVTPEHELFRERLLEIEYGEPNTKLQSIIQAPVQYGKNLVLIHHADDEYKKQLVTDKAGNQKIESVATGNKVMDGFKRTTEAADIVMKIYKEEVVEVVNGSKKTRKVFRGIVTKSGLHAQLEDMMFDDPSYEQIMAALKMLRGE